MGAAYLFLYTVEHATALQTRIQKAANELFRLLPASRDEATRTPDPYVPNVVRYQLRYIPCIVLQVQRYVIFPKEKHFYSEKTTYLYKHDLYPTI